MKENTINSTQEILSDLDIATIKELKTMPEFNHFQENEYIAYCQALKQFAGIICAMPNVASKGSTFTFIKVRKIKQAA